LGIKLLIEYGIIPVIITGRISDIVTNRANELGIKEVYQGIKDKITILDKVISKYETTYDEVAFIGDDINDLGLLKIVGISATPANAPKYIKDLVDLKIQVKGGDGAFRAFVEEMLISSNKMDYALSKVNIIENNQ
jgi:3-deoxy-D-manno-octulosonate 8-phosphate phosphatase (KDO 8-P phosphatase)